MAVMIDVDSRVCHRANAMAPQWFCITGPKNGPSATAHHEAPLPTLPGVSTSPTFFALSLSCSPRAGPGGGPGRVNAFANLNHWHTSVSISGRGRPGRYATAPRPPPSAAGGHWQLEASGFRATGTRAASHLSRAQMADVAQVDAPSDDRRLRPPPRH
eukprot:3939452-Rhodomonas_salina.2